MRRKNGEGTIYRRGDSLLWVGELTLGYFGGKRIKKTYSSKDLSALQRALNNGRVIVDSFNNADSAPNDGGYTVASWLAFWLDTYKRPTIKQSTYDRYEDSFNFYVKKHMGDMPLGAVRLEDVQVFYNTLFDAGFSTSTIKKSHVLLSGAFDQAVVGELLKKNPCQGTKIPKRPPKKQTALTVLEEERFVACCGNSPTYGGLFVFALNTGMRCGEITALTWDDIDLYNRLISVNKTAYVVKKRGKGDGGGRDGGYVVAVTEPKTKSGTRLIPMNKVVFELLLSRFESRSATTARIGGAVVGLGRGGVSGRSVAGGVSDRSVADGVSDRSVAGGVSDRLVAGGCLNCPSNVPTASLVFPNSAGGYLLYRNVLRALAVIVKYAAIPSNVTVHTLRHTFATRLLEKGANIKVVSELLGHASIQITLDTYSHVSPELKRSVVGLLDD